MIKRIVAFSLTALLAAAVFIFTPAFSFEAGQIPQASQLQVKAKDLQLVCPGGVYKTGGTTGTKLGSFEQVGTGTVASRFAGPSGVTVAESNRVLTVSDPAGAAQQGSMLLNANQTQLLGGASIAGLTGAACQRPASEQWLIGGDTSTGREALLILRNPTAVDATVNLEIFGRGGLVKAPGLTGLSVVAGKNLVLPLASYVPKTATFATHVTSTGGAIAAWIQQKTTHGLTPTGVDYISPSEAADKTQVIPGVFLRGTKDAAGLMAANADFADLQPAIRVFVPGTKDAVVTVQIIGATAKTFGTVIRQTISGGQVLDLPITGLADGDYVAQVAANVPVQASVRLSRTDKTKKPVADFTWLQSVPKFSSPVAISVPRDGISKLSVYLPETGRVQTIEVAAGSNYIFAADSKARYANLIVDVSGAIASIAVLDSKNAGGTVKVSVR